LTMNFERHSYLYPENIYMYYLSGSQFIFIENIHVIVLGVS